MVTKSTPNVIARVRELLPDVTDTDTAGLSDLAKYSRAIAIAKSKYPNLIHAIGATDCFAVSWEDEEVGKCTAGDDCALTKACEDAWNCANGKVTKKQSAAPAVAVRALQTNTSPISRRLNQNSAVVRRHVRNKWKGTGRYVRLNYVSTGRPIDTALTHLLEGLANPPSLPRNWHYSKLDEYVKTLGRIFLNPTPCYTAVLVDKRVLLRFWTNAASCASIDFAPEISGIVTPLKGFSRPREIPTGSLQKCFPCTHRIMLSLVATTHQESLCLLGAQLRMAFKL